MTIIGYPWSAGGTAQVAFTKDVPADGHMRELYIANGGPWQYADLNSGVLKPDSGSVLRAGYEWPAGGTKQVVFTQDPQDNYFNHIHELYVATGGSWAAADLTVLTGAPPAYEGVLTAFAWNAGGTKQIAYRSADGHIRELHVGVGGTWAAADLTQKYGAPSTAVPGGFNISGFEWQGLKEIVYVSNGNIYELYIAKGSTWKHANLTTTSGAPYAMYENLHGFAWAPGKTKQVVFTTSDRHIHELYVGPGGTWQHADLTQITKSPILLDVNFAFTAYSWDAGATKQVAYLGLGGHIHELYVGTDGIWRHADLTQAVGAPLPTQAAGARVFGYQWPKEASKHVLYPSDDGHIHQLSVKQGGAWKHVDLTTNSGAPALW
jgi:hypothetical protein